MKIPSRLKSPDKNHSVTAPSEQVFLGYDSMQYKHNNKTHRPGQKLPPYRKEYIWFQMYSKNFQASQCAKSHTLTKVIHLTLDIE